MMIMTTQTDVIIQPVEKPVIDFEKYIDDMMQNSENSDGLLYEKLKKVLKQKFSIESSKKKLVNKATFIEQELTKVEIISPIEEQVSKEEYIKKPKRSRKSRKNKRKSDQVIEIQETEMEVGSIA